MTRDTKSPHILISDREPGLPYSKGLMASQVMVTGLSPVRAYEVAEEVEQRLLALGARTATSETLDRLTLDVLEEIAGERYAKNYLRWREVEALEVPLVVLIGGTTGVGKSTIATQLATRLGIVRVVASDAVREVMRAMFSKELMPALHASSFEAGAALREPPGRDAAIVGFREQISAVAVGLQALVERAAIEGTDIILEGAHIVPGFLNEEAWRDRVLAVPVVITVEDEDVHRSHFVARWSDHEGRPAARYLEGFENIRRIQRFIKSQALSHGVPVVPNYDFDLTLAAVIDLVLERAMEHATRAGSALRAARGGGG